MKEIIERLVTNIFGIALGYVVGLIIYSSNASIVMYNGPRFFLVSTSLIGLVVSIAIIELGKVRTLKRNNLLRNEAITLIAHEMRTGLTSTGWAIQMVLSKYADHMSEEDKVNLETVLESVHTTVTHSVNLLDISILDLNKLSLSLKWVPLGEIEKTFNEILKGYMMEAQKNGIKIVAEMKLDKDKEVEVDVLRLKIVLQNLLENAVRYTIREKKEIEVSINNTDKDLMIKVSDSGIGIPEAEQKKIFNEFYRASNARVKLSTGSGIGLYACRQYVKAHRGEIRFESKENEGTTFYVSIPLKTRENINEFMEKV